MNYTSKCMLLVILLITLFPAHSRAATIYSIGATEGECFADSQELSMPCTISQICSPAHNTHYYYVEISQTGSYTFSASTGSVNICNSYGKPSNPFKLSPDRYYLKLYTGRFDRIVTLQCSKSSQNIRSKIPVKKITLKQRKKTIYTGKKFVIKPICKPSSATNKKICFRSSRKKVASVSSKGVVRGKKSGKATITASAADNKKIKVKCRVTVCPKKKIAKKSAKDIAKIPTPKKDTSPQTKNRQDFSQNTSAKKPEKKKTAVTKIRLSASLVTLQTGKSTALHATVLPTNASNKELSWKSLDPSVATVSNGKILAKKRGITTIIVTSRDNSACSSCCTVSVR